MSGMHSLCVAEVSIVNEQVALVGIGNHGIGCLPPSTEAQPVAFPGIVKL